MHERGVSAMDDELGGINRSALINTLHEYLGLN